MVGLGQAIGSLTNGLVDATDLYRASLVMAVAAWDRYIHGIVLDRAVDIVLGRYPPGAATRFGLPIHAIAAMISATDNAAKEIAVKTYMAERLSKETFQHPGDVASGLAMVGITKVWSAAFADAESAKTAIGVIVSRRNNIVHACDYDPTMHSSLMPLDDSDAMAAVQTITNAVSSIDALCARYRP
jgi:hypothetical protein